MNNNPANIIRDVRMLMPTRLLEAHEAKIIAERQAMRLLEMLGVAEAPVDMNLLTELPRIEVRVDERLAQLGLSGLSESSPGKWVITINSTDAITRRRFTLGHELKHVLDHPFMRTLYPKRAQRDNPTAERICDYFAACLLMPRVWVKQRWYGGTQDVAQLAAYFRVSPAAMAMRLQQLGVIERTRRYRSVKEVAQYFRTVLPAVAMTP